VLRAQVLAEGEKRDEDERDDDSAGDAEAHGCLRDRQEEELANRGVRLPGVKDDHEGHDDDDVEGECSERQEGLAAWREVAPREQPDAGAAGDERTGRDPRPPLVPGRVAVAQDADLDEREGNRKEPDPRDPALDLPLALEIAVHRRRSSAHSACSRSRSSSLSLQRSTAGASATSPELPAAMSALRRR
jgi:hypothetical protein